MEHTVTHTIQVTGFCTCAADLNKGRLTLTSTSSNKDEAVRKIQQTITALQRDLDKLNETDGKEGN